VKRETQDILSEGIIMASAAQIRANRSNARKSTGPRTAEGKEKASQNAVKHGLLAREAVIVGEDPTEFEAYREGMLGSLAPVGPVEAMLAERVAGLSWRLRRAERLQNIAFAALDEGEPAALLEARLKEWKQHKGSERDRTACGVLDENAALGKLVVEDFAEARVLDRMLMYERRIESSLYRTMAELRKEQEARKAGEASRSQGNPAVDREVNKVNQVNKVLTPRSKGDLAVDREPATPAELASFDESASEEASSVSSDFPLQTPHLELQEKITPYGVTTNEEDGNHGQDARAAASRATSGEGQATPCPAEPLHPSPFTVLRVKRTQSREEPQVGRAKRRTGN